MISDSTAGSRPFLTPRARASLVPAIRMASIMLLQILATWPAPWGPAWKIFFPLASQTGRARLKVKHPPPQVKGAGPALGPPTPPKTGATEKHGLFIAPRA